MHRALRGGSAIEQGLNALAQRGQQRVLDPRIGEDSWRVARRRVLQKDERGRGLPPRSQRVGQRRLPSAAEEVAGHAPRRAGAVGRAATGRVTRPSAVARVQIQVADSHPRRGPDSKVPSGSARSARRRRRSPRRRNPDARSRSPLASAQSMPLSCTRAPQACPRTRMRAAAPTCRTGRGPSGGCAAQTRRARTATSSSGRLRKTGMRAPAAAAPHRSLDVVQAVMRNRCRWLCAPVQPRDHEDGILRRTPCARSAWDRVIGNIVRRREQRVASLARCAPP